MSQCVWWINNFWTNGLKVIEFRVIFVIENELKFTNLGFNQLLHFHYIDPLFGLSDHTRNFPFAISTHLFI